MRGRHKKAIITFCREIDSMLGGGVPRGELTEVSRFFARPDVWFCCHCGCCFCCFVVLLRVPLTVPLWLFLSLRLLLLWWWRWWWR